MKTYMPLWGFALFLNLCQLSLYSQNTVSGNVLILGAEHGSYDNKVVNSTYKGYRGSRQEIPLSGAWYVQLDSAQLIAPNRMANGISRRTKLNLPGTLDDAKIGVPELPSSGHLVRKHKYIGIAWYERDIEIPQNWENKEIRLWLDRVMWESRLYIDGILIGSEESLSTPHSYSLGAIKPGKHRITLRIDNSPRPGASCHGYGDAIQIQWNGVVGKMALIAHDKVYIKELNIYPDLKSKLVKVKAVLKNTLGEKMVGELGVAIHLKNDTAILGYKSTKIRVSGEEYLVDFQIPVKDVKLWDEFNPQLYEASAILTGKGDSLSLADNKNEVFGMRELGKQGHKLLFNGNPVYFRGTHDAAGFPMVGYIPADKESWLKRFSEYKSYGLNHVRFHSVCPPIGAFEAADELGIYLQVELPFWGNVGESWEGSPFLQRELDRIVEAYGNHPSFCLLTMGNEHNGDWDYLDRMTERIKRMDNRHFYAAASNQYIRPTKEVQVGVHDDFSTLMWGDDKTGRRFFDRIRYMERLMNGGDIERDKDYRDLVDPFPVPFIGHELGQYWMYPDFSRVGKYNGVLTESGLIAFKDDVTKKGLMPWSAAFCKASGEEAVQLYKEDIERFMRTPNTSGYQLLDTRDYTGQGTALVGILFDSFGDTKNFISPEEFKTFCAPVVIISRIPKQAYTDGEAIEIPIEVCNYSQQDIQNEILDWSIENEKGEKLNSGSFDHILARKGQISPVAKIKTSVSSGKSAQLTVKVSLKSSQIHNHWRIWSYVRNPKVANRAGKVKVVDSFDDNILAFVEQGGRVLYLGTNQMNSTVPIQYVNSIWSPFYTVSTCGNLINDKHPLFKDFPTSGFSDFQWLNLMKNSRAFVLNATPKQYNPIVWAIESPAMMRNFKLGTIVEMAYGKGVIIGTTLNLTETEVTQHPEIKQLKQSLLNYAATASPKQLQHLNKETIRSVFYPSNITTAKMPDNCKNALLEIYPSYNLKANGVEKWDKKNDKYIAKDNQYDYALYRIQSEGSIPRASTKEGTFSAWNLEKTTLEIKCPANFTGKLYLKFDASDNKVGGYCYFAGSAFQIQKSEKNSGICLELSPEMVSDGKLKLNFWNEQYAPLLTYLLLTQSGESNLK